MIRADFFIEAMSKAGFGLFTGVPCSYLTPFINTVIDSPSIHYIPAANEGDAVAIACGAELGGRRAVVMFQNSGLGNAVSPLTSLTSTFRLPVLVITTWRGQLGGPVDEPQHETMGRITPALLELMDIPWELFPKEESDIEAVLARAIGHMDKHGTPYALVMPFGIVQEGSGTNAGKTDDRVASNPRVHDHRQYKQTAFPQDDALRTIQANVAESDAVLATTGFTGRALYALDDRPNQFYMVGSMGCVSSLGLGLATVQPERRVVVIDGDGALLMRMGALATNGFQSPGNLIHVVLDNGCHDSTGSQRTVSSTMDFTQLAMACGYRKAVQISELEELAEILQNSSRELTLVHVKTEARQNRKLPRPVVTPAEVAMRFRKWLADTTCITESTNSSGARA
ncbi:MAG: phosphonopyruvate decarboxylase [Pirellulaceae bacterium]